MKTPSEIVEENIAKTGLQTERSATDFFTKSKTGLEVIWHLIKKFDEEEHIKAFYMRTKFEIQAQVAILLRSIRNEEEAAAAVIDLINQQIQIAAKSQTKLPPLPKDIKLEAINSLVGELNNTQDEIKKAETRYEEYARNLNQVDQFISTLDPHDHAKRLAQVKAEIARLEGTPEQRARETDDIYKLLEEDREDEARAKMDCLNAKNLQIGTLNDMVSVLENKKLMYNKEGERVTSFKEADFVVPKDQKILKVGKNYYLLGEKEELSASNREASQQGFKRAESEMQSVKNLVGANHGVEFNALHKEVSCISAQLDKLQEVSLTPLADTKTAFDHGDFREATALTAHQLSGQQHEQHEQQEEYSFDFEQTYGL